MTRHSRGEPLGCDSPSVVRKGAKVRARPRPAKVTTWKGWGVLMHGVPPCLYPTRRAADDDWEFIPKAKLVCVVATCREVGRR